MVYSTNSSKMFLKSYWTSINNFSTSTGSSKTTLNYRMMVERYSNIKEEVGSSNPGRESPLRCWHVRFFVSKKRKKKDKWTQRVHLAGGFPRSLGWCFVVLTKGGGMWNADSYTFEPNVLTGPKLVNGIEMGWVNKHIGEKFYCSALVGVGKPNL